MLQALRCFVASAPSDGALRDIPGHVRVGVPSLKPSDLFSTRFDKQLQRLTVPKVEPQGSSCFPRTERHGDSFPSPPICTAAAGDGPARSPAQRPSLRHRRGRLRGTRATRVGSRVSKESNGTSRTHLKPWEFCAMQKRLAKDGEQQGKASDGFGIRRSISHGGCLLGWGQRLVSIYPSCLRDLLRSLVQHQKYWIYACHILSLSLSLSLVLQCDSTFVLGPISQISTYTSA